MTYKQKTLSTLFALIVGFGFLYFDGKSHGALHNSSSFHDIIPLVYFTTGWDKPLIPFDLETRRQRCKADPECNKLAEAVVYEARNDTLFGQYAVASVILNRVDDRRWPNTIRGVVHQGNGSQFEYLKNMHIQKKPTQADWDTARVVAFDLTNGIMQRVTDANHYYNPRTVRRKPRFAEVYEYVLSTQFHDFHKW